MYLAYDSVAVTCTFFWFIFLVLVQRIDANYMMKTLNHGEIYSLQNELKMSVSRTDDESNLLDQLEEKVRWELQGVFDRSLLNDSGCPQLNKVKPYPEPKHSHNIKCRLHFVGYNMSRLE